MASVTFEGVTRRYRDVVAVRDLDLEIADSEFLVLVGPSGCGKTTVLRLIAGLEVPDAGRVLFDRADVRGVRPAERNVAMVFEGYALYPHLAVRDNLAFALRLRHVPDSEVSTRVSNVAGAMELKHLLKRRPQGLATGEAQHVAVGRAVIRDRPAVLLLDDALSHLDARQRLEARAEVGRLHRDLRSTIVSVTHDQAEALAMGTRVAVMDDGVLMQVGAPRELYERPANVFVAGFIGSPSMNLVDMELRSMDGRAALLADALEWPVPGGIVPGSSRSVTVGIRPVDIRMTAASEDHEAGFRGRCEHVEYLGPHLLVHLRVGDHALIVIDDPADDIDVGDVLDCSFSVTGVHLFDTATGRALG